MIDFFRGSAAFANSEHPFIFYFCSSKKSFAVHLAIPVLIFDETDQKLSEHMFNAKNFESKRKQKRERERERERARQREREIERERTRERGRERERARERGRHNRERV